MGTSPEENRTRPATERPGQPRENVTSARGVTSARFAGRGRQGGTGAAAGDGGGGWRGRGREAAGKPRLPGPVSARVVPVGGASRGGAGRSMEPRPLGERWTGRAPRLARAAGKTKTNVQGQWEVGSAAGWAVQGGAITGLLETPGLREGKKN